MIVYDVQPTVQKLSGAVQMDALEYNAEADKKSWAAMLELFKEVFR
jgi:hypothetical protein